MSAAGKAATAAALSNDALVPGAERVRIAREGLLQALQTAEVLIEGVSKDRSDDSPLFLSLAVRLRDLVDASDLLLADPDCCDPEDAITKASRTIFGRSTPSRVTEGAAS